MSDSDLLTDDDVRPERANEPAKRWRNEYWFEEPYKSLDGRTFGPGLQIGSGAFPSVEIAEQRALEFVAWFREHASDVEMEWLGAFPIEGDA